jgi:hypothetical protein
LNDRPDFDPDQLFICVLLQNGGKDLESFRFNSCKGVTGILTQTILALAVAERELRFEHRDLHWGIVFLLMLGNLLIRDEKKRDSTISVVIGGVTLNIKNDGLVASIIDFNLSRLESDGKVYALALTDDEELFMGEGDMQFDTYRYRKLYWLTFQTNARGIMRQR